MGAAGAGKSTIGRALANALGWRFADADDLHSADAVAQMRRGVPLTDEQREPWLDRVHRLAADAVRAGESLVVACSALKERYRARIGDGLAGIVFVYLEAGPELLHARVSGRPSHFMPESLVDSQLATLEPPADAIRVDAALPVDAQVAVIRRALDV